MDGRQRRPPQRRLDAVQPDHHPHRSGLHRTRRPAILRTDAGPQACLDWIGTLGLRQDITYQPASHFWPLQWTETGIFVAAAVLLAGFCFWWTRRRLT